MKITGSGLNEDVELSADGLHGAVRISLRPQEVGSLGAYSLSLRSGAMNGGTPTNAYMFGFAWLNPNLICRVTRFTVQAMTGGTGPLAAGGYKFRLLRAGNIGNPGEFGQSLTITGKDQARASRFADTVQRTVGAGAFGSTTGFPIVYANTLQMTNAAIGSYVADHNPLEQVIGGVQTGTWQIFPGLERPFPLIDPREAGRQPVELAYGEGLVMDSTIDDTTMFWVNTIQIDWEEVDAHRYALFG